MRTLILLCALGLSAALASAQTAPPIHGVTGTYVPEETIKSEHDGTRGIAEGVGAVVGYAKKLFSFGGKGAGEDPLAGLEGQRVVLREGDDTTEGFVIDVNRRKQQFTVRISQKKTETLRVIQPGGQPDVAVSYTDQTGAKVERGFARVS